LWVCVSNWRGLATVCANLETGWDPGKAKKPGRIPAKPGWLATMLVGFLCNHMSLWVSTLKVLGALEVHPYDAKQILTSTE
jgi:hypothetical protein